MAKLISRLGKNEARVIKIPREAIEKILWESLMENGDYWFDLKRYSDDIIFRMKFDETMSELVFYACDFPNDKPPRFDEFDEYIENNIGFTANSMYNKHECGSFYQTVLLPDRVESYK